jgi:hypothetical protein
MILLMMAGWVTAAIVLALVAIVIPALHAKHNQRSQDLEVEHSQEDDVEVSTLIPSPHIRHDKKSEEGAHFQEGKWEEEATSAKVELAAAVAAVEDAEANCSDSDLGSTEWRNALCRFYKAQAAADRYREFTGEQITSSESYEGDSEESYEEDSDPDGLYPESYMEVAGVIVRRNAWNRLGRRDPEDY